jgi:probable F420-dependent oxidoreductase
VVDSRENLMTIEFGLSTLSRGTLVSRAAYLQVAQAAERAGFAFISVNDHLIVPGHLGSAYPYTQGGAWAAAEHGHCFDQLTTLAFVAGCTSRIKLLTSVMVVPHRPPIATAKILSTIDVLSGGRLILGVGAGWMKEEFALLGAPFAERGTVTDEYLEACKALWTQQRPTFAGKHVTFDDVIFEPKPIQKPHPPIWVGGESPAALRRAVKLGDAWYPGNNSQTEPLDTPARLAAAVGSLRRLAQAAGRDPASLAVNLIVQNPFEWTSHKTADGSARRLFTGASTDMTADAVALDAVGVRHVAVRLGGATLRESLEHIDRFGREVIAQES